MNKLQNEPKDMETKKIDIENLGLNAIQDYFKIDISQLDANVLKHLHLKARLGMQFEKEMSLSKRAVEMNYLRVFKMIAEDKNELKKYIQKSMPKYYPM